MKQSDLCWVCNKPKQVRLYQAATGHIQTMSIEAYKQICLNSETLLGSTVECSNCGLIYSSQSIDLKGE